MAKERAGRHQDDGRHGQQVLFAPEDGRESRQHETQQEDGHADRHHGDDHRVDHRAFDLGSRLGFLVEVLGELLQHVAERTGDLGRRHHVDVEVAEDLRVLRQRLGEAVALLDVNLQVVDHSLELLVVLLAANSLQGILETDAGANHDRQLAGEMKNVLAAGPEFDPESPQLAHDGGIAAGAAFGLAHAAAVVYGAAMTRPLPTLGSGRFFMSCDRLCCHSCSPCAQSARAS